MLWHENEGYLSMGTLEHDGVLFWKQWLHLSIMGLFWRIWQIFCLRKYFARVCSINMFLYIIIIIIIVLPWMYTVSHFGLMYGIFISVYWVSCKHRQRHCIDGFFASSGQIITGRNGYECFVLFYLCHMLCWFCLCSIV